MPAWGGVGSPSHSSFSSICLRKILGSRRLNTLRYPLLPARCSDVYRLTHSRPKSIDSSLGNYAVPAIFRANFIGEATSKTLVCILSLAAELIHNTIG
jgi:hypothetical protein